MKITFNGVPGEPDVKSITLHGYTFELGKAVDVTSKLAQAELGPHPFFSGGDAEVKRLVLPQTIPSVESAAVVSYGHESVSEIERNAINADPRMLPGAQVSYDAILEAKEPNADFRVSPESASQTDGVEPRRKPGRPRSTDSTGKA